MAKPLIQVALDTLDFEQTLKLAASVAPYVDILEIGTPSIKFNGIGLVKALKAAHPRNKVLVDLKTMDAGLYEAKPFYNAGADIVTVLGVAGIATIKGVIEAANAYGKQTQIDLINVPDKAALAREGVAAGAHILGVHTGLDAQAAGHTPFADLQGILNLNLGATVSVAGGINQSTVQQVARAGAGIVVVGAAIYGAASPAAAAKEIRGLVDAL
ncbi:3-hexulose-6-phosphate synthase [Methylococcus sp. EFPC2]|uniref:3-hexulose-6-phosphate synthase n=1 Tax=Methylococcus sp. EFPC2 TaxID=2812648 RepID=UPI0019677EFA|nr:3-hexulose-6-phosphate synthase [Methylococcus sp. EFPC2]QSA96379.1 3-hexulose-6-phosphate synthase [Methylococcus sp. EFPC2]